MSDEPEQQTPDVNNGDWYGHNRGLMPVHPKTRVTITYASNREADTCLAEEINWKGYSGGFRVVKEFQEGDAPPPEERWIVGRESCLTKKGAEGLSDRFGDRVIHMIEVVK
jgi:hypothetical protein